MSATGDYELDGACKLFEEHAGLNDGLSTALDRLEEELPGETVVGATGCPSCGPRTDLGDVFVWFVAQREHIGDSVTLNFDVGEDAPITRHELGERIVDIVEDIGTVEQDGVARPYASRYRVSADWDEDVSDPVTLSAQSR